MKNRYLRYARESRIFARYGFASAILFAIGALCLAFAHRTGLCIGAAMAAAWATFMGFTMRQDALDFEDLADDTESNEP